MYGGGLRWNKGILSVGEDKHEYEQPELEAFHLLEENENTIVPGEMTLHYWKRFNVSDVPPNHAAAFTTALSEAYLKRLYADRIGKRDAPHRDYTALLGRALEHMASAQYEDQFADGKKVVDGDQVMQEVKIAYDNMLHGLDDFRLEATVAPDWEPRPDARWERTAQGWRPRARGWDDFEPGEQFPLGPGWGGKRSRKRSRRSKRSRRRKTH